MGVDPIPNVTKSYCIPEAWRSIVCAGVADMPITATISRARGLVAAAGSNWRRSRYAHHDRVRHRRLMRATYRSRYLGVDQEGNGDAPVHPRGERVTEFHGDVLSHFDAPERLDASAW